MPFERLRDVPLAQLGVTDDALDGPFLLLSGGFGLLVSLRGKGGGTMPSPSELRWPRDLPPAAKAAPIAVFFRREASALFLGTASVTGRGSPAPTKDGFKLSFSLEVPLSEAEWSALLAEASPASSPPPEEAIAALGTTSRTADRVAAMRVFLERWHGAVAAAVPEDEDAGHAAIPGPLRVLHAHTAHRPLCAQNRLVSSEELAQGGRSRAHDDTSMLVFYVENQGVFRWAVDTNVGVDPPVWVQANDHGPAAPWRPEADSLSAFLLGLLVIEGTFGAPFGASQDGLDRRGMARLTKRMRPLPLPSWSTTGTRVFGGGGVIGFSQPGGDGSEDVWLGARDRQALEPFERLVEDWPDVRF